MTKSLKLSDKSGKNVVAKPLFFCNTPPNSEKILLPQFQCCCSQTTCIAWARITLMIGGREDFWFLPQFFSGIVVLAILSLKKEDWALTYNSMKF